MNSVEEIADAIVHFVRAELDVPPDRCGPETPLFSGGLLDSFALVTLLAFVEERWSVALLDADVALEALDSPRTLAAYVHTARSVPPS